jgi:hypothetical protein
MRSGLLFGNLFKWNRKLHIYAGLLLLFYIMFFSCSGLLLNHSQWEFASFWKERKESETVTQITIPEIRDTGELIRDCMKLLSISGEVGNVKSTPEKISFRAGKPGLMHDISIDLKSGECICKKIVFNWWGKIRNLHTFNGSDREHPEASPNWQVTRIWRFVMDAVASGLIFLCLSSWIMWFKVRQSYPAGFIILLFGFIAASVFVFLLKLV